MTDCTCCYSHLCAWARALIPAVTVSADKLRQSNAKSFVGLEVFSNILTSPVRFYESRNSARKALEYVILEKNPPWLQLSKNSLIRDCRNWWEGIFQVSFMKGDSREYQYWSYDGSWRKVQIPHRFGECKIMCFNLCRMTVLKIRQRESLLGHD